jgi:hypothetical protein
MTTPTTSNGSSRRRVALLGREVFLPTEDVILTKRWALRAVGRDDAPRRDRRSGRVSTGITFITGDQHGTRPLLVRSAPSIPPLCATIAPCAGRRSL